MASFAQNRPLQFSSYIPPTDLQQTHALAQEELAAEVKVGMFKEGQYQAAAQKIQGQVESVLGLQVTKEQDKQYLQQAQTEMKNQLSSVVGGDLTKSAIFNQASSVAAKVYNDPLVQNAVMSTRNKQDMEAQIAEARKNGKSAASNDNMLLRKIRAWENDGQVGSTLSKDTYTNYFDHTGELQKFLKDKHPNTIIRQNPFQGGWDAYTLIEGKEEKISSIDLKRDIEAFYQSNAQALGQLDIDATFYSDQTPNDVAFQNFQQSFLGELEDTQARIKQLQEDSNLNPSNATKNQIEIIRLQDEAAGMQAAKPDLEKRFLASAEGAKKALFRDNLIKNMANRYAYTNTEQKIVKNPIRDAMMDEAKFSLDRQKFAWSQEMDMKRFDQDERKMVNDINAASIAAGITVSTGLDAASAVQIEPQQKEADLKNMARRVTQEQLAALYEANPNSDLINVGQDASGQPLYTLKPGRTDQDFHNQFAAFKQSYIENPDGASRAAKDYFGDPTNGNTGEGLAKSYFAQANLYNNIEADLNRKYGAKMKAYNDEVSKVGPMEEVLYNRDGETITRADLVKVARFSNDLRLEDKAKVARETGMSEDKVALIMQQARGIGRTVLEKAGNVLNQIGSLGLNDLSPLSEEYDKVRKIAKNKDFDEMYAAKRDAYQRLSRNSTDVAIVEPINPKNRIKSESLIAHANGLGLGESFNQVTGEKGAGDLTVVYYKNGMTGTMTAALKNSNGTTSEAVPLNPIIASQLNPALTQQNPFKGQDIILNSNMGLVSGVPVKTGNSAQDAYPVVKTNSKKYDFRFHIQRDASESRFAPIMYYKPKNSKDWLPLPYDFGYMSQEQANALPVQIASQGDEPFEAQFLSQ